jgi:hypothetical protein
MSKPFFTPFLLLTMWTVLGQAATTKWDFVTSEPTQFTSTEQQKLLKLGQPPDFIGVLTRENKGSIEKDIDVYEFRKRSDLKLTKEICTQLAELVVGPLKKISLKLLSSELKDSVSTGKICFFSFQDPDPQARIKERHLLINILNLRTIGYVFRYERPATVADVTDETKFVESLRLAKSR